ncbi:MAG: beta-carotene hydroxylase [Pseudomonadota bacterium]
MNPLHVFLAIAAFLATELAAMLIHKYVMHGIGWGWHKSHHVRRHGIWEKNDLYAIVFSVATLLLFILGGTHAPLWWVALGISVYGLLYGLLHDVLVHQRLPFRWRVRNRYIKHLVTAHHLHHASTARHGGVSFGFLYAPSLSKIRRRMRQEIEQKTQQGVQQKTRQKVQHQVQHPETT